MPPQQEPYLEQREAEGYRLPFVFVFPAYEAFIGYAPERRQFLPRAALSAALGPRAAALYDFFVQAEGQPYVDFPNALELLHALEGEPELETLLLGFVAAYRTSFAGHAVLSDIRLNFSSLYKAVAFKKNTEPLRHLKVWICDKKYSLKATVYKRAKLALMLNPQCFVEFDDFGKLIALTTANSAKDVHKRLLISGSSGVSQLNYV